MTSLDDVLQRAEFELYRDNIDEALNLLDRASARSSDSRYATRAATIRSWLRHLESPETYAQAYEAYYWRAKGSFRLKHLERELRILTGHRARSIARKMALDPEFRQLEAELVASRARRLLDAGCGEGRVALALAARHPDVEVEGIEVSHTNWRLACRTNRFPNARFRRGLLEEAETLWAPASFDLVYAFAVLEHVRDPDAALQAMLRMLRPEGRLCLVVPMNGFERQGPLPEFAHPDGVAGHVRCFTEGALRRWLGQYPRFSLTKIPGAVPAKYPPTLAPREFGSFFVAFSPPQSAASR